MSQMYEFEIAYARVAREYRRTSVRKYLSSSIGKPLECYFGRVHSHKNQATVAAAGDRMASGLLSIRAV